MGDEPRTMTKTELRGVLHRVGVDSAAIDTLLEPLDDPVDLDKAGPYLYQHGLSMERLINRMGGSP